jgi:hypothetical protein
MLESVVLCLPRVARWPITFLCYGFSFFILMFLSIITI